MGSQLHDSISRNLGTGAYPSAEATGDGWRPEVIAFSEAKRDVSYQLNEPSLRQRRGHGTATSVPLGALGTLGRDQTLHLSPFIRCYEVATR